jgi:NIPSNAP
MSTPTFCPVLELRQYTLRPGMRDVLIELFEREFVESQEALGITLVGQFRDLDDPNRFVWLRGFADMTTRAQALHDFYGGPVWKAHREAANETMTDSDNVLLLRPARPGSGFSLDSAERPAPGARTNPRGLAVATIYHLKSETEHDLVDFFERALQSELSRAGASVLSYFVTEKHPNTFPALPVRETANVFVWFSVFADEMTYERHEAALANSISWKNNLAELGARLNERPEILRLLPTQRSRLHR